MDARGGSLYSYSLFSAYGSHAVSPNVSECGVQGFYQSPLGLISALLARFSALSREEKLAAVVISHRICPGASLLGVTNGT